MSGAFFNPYALTGGPGAKANPTYDEFLHKHSGFYRKHSVSGKAMEEDRRASLVDPAGAEDAAGGRRSSLATATGGAAATNIRKGSVVVGSTAERRDSVFGLEASAGTTMDPGRRNSTSLASDLIHKMKGGSRKGSHTGLAHEEQVPK